ncbi:restriction endonuclease subunit S [Leuconostoc pseudomesenteroides]|uniref:restriction endonuclease subunit S n=1 Tax=Leuconostoc pseudomesenteroides TaxID=33968 RepID=UPI0021A43F36|nr:restriction endonuclease subunit S [Leuconostoc pseudomesenteroides]MCT4380642.1 restriction endonuclease subunit S [Leuconostoc pseudomesenteroides]
MAKIDDSVKKKVPELRFPGFTDDWEERKLNENVENIGTGRSSFKAGLDYSEQTPYEVLGSTSVISYSDSFDHSGNFVLTARVGANAGNLYKHSGNVKISDNTVYIQSKNLEFIFYLLTKYDLKKLAFGTGQPLIKASELKNLKLFFPKTFGEQQKIGSFFKQLDETITLHQRKLDLLKEQKKGFLQKMFPKNGAKVPELRFEGFTDDWEDRELGEEFKKVSERNDGSFGRDHWISVAKMYFQSPEKVQSNNIDTRTYVMREGDIAFEGHPNSEFKFGRFVANDIGAGVVSELFPIYKHQHEYDNNYWKNAIQIERIMAPIFAKSITSSGNSSNKLDTKHFLRQKILIPQINEQKKMGSFFKQLDNTIALHQRKLDLLKEQKKGYLQKMFAK